MANFGQTFGELVRQRRGALGLTQEALASQAFGDPARMSRISELENGRVARPQQKTVAALAATLEISDAEIAACRRGAAPAAPTELPAASPQDIDGKPRTATALVDALAQAFGVEDAGLGPREIVKRLKAKAAELKRLQAEQAKQTAAKAELKRMADAAEAAWRAGDPAEVAEKLAEVEAAHQTPRALAELRALANMRQAQAEALLQANDVPGAVAAFEAAAGFLGPLAPDEAFDRRLAGVKRLTALGEATAADAAADLAEAILAETDPTGAPARWATLKTLHGAAKIAAARDLDPEAAVVALNAAIESVCDALQVLTPTEHGQDWSRTQGHLGRALEAQAHLADAAEAPRLRAMAAGAYRNALKGRDLADDRDAADIAAALSALEHEAQAAA